MLMLSLSLPRLARLASGLFGAAIVCSSLSAQIYNAFDDFSYTDNPNGAWSYGTVVNNTASFVPLGASSVWGGQLKGWSTNPTDFGFPYILKSTTGLPVQTGGTLHPGDALSLHPENFGRSVVIRWTAPVDGEYTFSGFFKDIPTEIAATVDVTVRKNTTPLLTAFLNANYTAYNFSGSNSFLAGETLDFIVGPSGDFYWDHTAFDATIALVPPSTNPGAVPEPSTYGLIAAAALGGLIAYRRRSTGAHPAKRTDGAAQ